MRVVDKTFLTEDEQYDPAGKAAESVARALEAARMDAYNARYVIRVTVDRVDDDPD